MKYQLFLSRDKDGYKLSYNKPKWNKKLSMFISKYIFIYLGKHKEWMPHLDVGEVWPVVGLTLGVERH